MIILTIDNGDKVESFKMTDTEFQNLSDEFFDRIGGMEYHSVYVDNMPFSTATEVENLEF